MIGLGAMGMPMAKRLADRGHAVVAVDPNPTARAKAETFGMSSRETMHDAPPSDVVLVTVATGPQLMSVVEAGSASRTVGEELWILCSTVGQSAAQDAARLLNDKGAKLVDAPMTGGVPGAERGELTFFVAGDSEEIDELTTVLGVLGTTRFVGGDVGGGQAMKMVNQLCCSVHLAVAAEAVALAVKLGLNPEIAVDVVTKGAGASWFLNERGPRMAQLDSVPDVSTRLAILAKDIGLVKESAVERGAHIPLLEAAEQQYARAAELGLLESDDSQLVRSYL
ncbi:hypothetical protein ASG84_11445 [Rhodococcus sp. Leaf278]|nr:hypothetical protein ASG84_11445 [Rhodococcus sp. Leaf278]